MISRTNFNSKACQMGLSYALFTASHKISFNEIFSRACVGNDPGRTLPNQTACRLTLSEAHCMKQINVVLEALFHLHSPHYMHTPLI